MVQPHLLVGAQNTNLNRRTSWRGRVIDWVRARVARGYQPDPSPATSIEFIPQAPGDLSTEPANHTTDEPRRDRSSLAIGVLTPTYVGRCSHEQHSQTIAHVLDQIAEIHATFPTIRLVYFLGMQWANEAERAEAVARLRSAHQLTSARQGIEFVGLSLPGPGKLRTLNAVIDVAGAMQLTGLLWIDDDIQMAPSCLSRLTARFVSKHARGAVGATKIPRIGTTPTSKLLRRAKGVSGSAMNFPHGCCMLVETKVLVGGIPDRYPSDDVYVCFRLLSPRAPNPLEHLELVADACCSYTSGGAFGSTIGKIRRILLNQHVYLADWPVETSRCYFQHVLFTGLWPLAPWDGARGWRAGLGKLMLQWLYFTVFTAAGAELILRGFFRAPLRRIGWN